MRGLTESPSVRPMGTAHPGTSLLGPCVGAISVASYAGVRHPFSTAAVGRTTPAGRAPVSSSCSSVVMPRTKVAT